MGQSQSSNSAAPDTNNNGAKTDFYILLGVEDSATAEEIKKAYRRKALELHPDRNFGNVEESTALFAEVQSAYEVLSDPQERAWYDSHKDAILFGHDGAEEAQSPYNSSVTTTEDIMKLIMKFNPRMEFSDAPSGFFGGLCEIFDQLAREEAEACRYSGIDADYYPSFEGKDAGMDDVRRFYSIWSGFGTKKSFSWKDVYRYSEAPDRRVRRIMEKENKRLREDAIREFNDAVRSLVAFARKRDPRYKMTAQSEAERQRLLRESAAAQAARSRKANNAKLQEYTLPSWAQTEEVEEEFTTSESEPELQVFECVVCNKTFKSEKQFEAHERSKKHIKTLKQLQWEMKHEDRQLNLNIPDAGENTAFRLDNTSPPPGSDEDDILESDIDDDISNLSSPALSHSQPENHDNVPLESPPENLENINRGDDDVDDDQERVEIIPDVVESKEQPKNDDINVINKQLSETTIADESAGSGTPAKLGKAKQKRAKKAAQQLANQEKNNGFVCVTCRSSFQSRSKLFTHIKKLDHAQPPTKPPATRRK